MAIVRIQGGLGNQMFQYAMARNYEKKYLEKICFDIDCKNATTPREYELDKLNIKEIEKVDGKDVLKYRKYRKICEKYKTLKIFSGILNYEFEKKEFEVQKINKCSYLDGYWQNIKYFEDIKDILNKEFIYSWKLKKEQKNIINYINNSNSIGIHVRRGDYLNIINASYHETQNLDYYKRAVEYVERIIENPTFFVFSDDIDWCKQAFLFNDFCFIDKNINNNALEDFEMLKSCSHHIISNSTFSWWAAWLSKTQNNIVIAPEKWYKDKDLNNKCKSAILNNMIIM